MRRPILFIFLAIILSSCQFKCEVNKQNETESTQPGTRMISGAAVYNGIDLKAHKLQLDKAYLVYDGGERIPNDNFVDFSLPVKLILEFNGGWTVKDGKVSIGASEKVLAENGAELLDEKDLFGANGIVPEKDANVVSLTVNIRPNTTTPTHFIIHFTVWDKNSDGFVRGSYKLYTK